MSIPNLASLYDEITLTPEERKKPALLRPITRVTSRIENDKIGVCPHCAGRMEFAKINVARLGGLTSVYWCDKDRYVAPLKDE